MSVAQAELDKCQTKVDRRLVTVENYEEHARNCVNTALDYFKSKFVEDDAPLKLMMNIYESAKVCNPKVLVTLDEHTAEKHVEFLAKHMSRLCDTTLKTQLKGWNCFVM